MKSYKKLFNNVILFALGNLGSRVISFILVPLYTYYLSQAEYGVIDLVLATQSMILPLITFETQEAIIRFIIEKKSSKNKIFSNSLFISIVSFIIFLSLYPILINSGFLKGYLKYLYLLLFIQMIYQLINAYTRAVGKINVYAFNGILLTFSTGILNILFLVKFQLGIDGYFWSLILAYIISIVYLSINIFPLQIDRKNILQISTIKMILSYSIPLIPNSLMWWLINSSSRYLINWQVGIEANGLFAISSKIPSLLSIVTTVFSQAWKLSAFEEFNAKDREIFYSKIFEYYYVLLFLISSSVLLILRPMFYYIFSDSFYRAWESVPFLLLGSVFSALSGFMGVIYTASKETKGVLRTSLYGGIISLVMNIFLIRILGNIGAGISSFISFFIMFVIRAFDTRKYIFIKLNTKKFIFNLTIILIQVLVLFIFIDYYIMTILLVLLFVVLLVYNYRNIIMIIKYLFKMLRSKI